MSIKKITRLLLLLLLIVDIILSVMVYSIYNRKYYIEADYINDAVDIFTADGISITSDAIPDERFQAYIYSTAMSDNYYEDTADMLSEDEVSIRFRLPEGYAITMKSGDRFEFGAGYYFKFIKSSCPENAQSPLLGEAVTSSGRIEKIKDSIALFLLGEADTQTYSYTFDTEAVNYSESDGLYSVTIHQTVDGVRLYGQGITVITDSEYNVLYIEGNWCFSPLKDRFSAQIYDQVNILFIDKASGTYEGEKGVTDMKPYYIIYNNADFGEALIIPAWEITYQSGEVNVYNAENGELYTPSRLEP